MFADLSVHMDSTISIKLNNYFYVKPLFRFRMCTILETFCLFDVMYSTQLYYFEKLIYPEVYVTMERLTYDSKPPQVT